jgi:phospholipid/cholesterol/gamma-HCH transport system substrate-binding protein
VNRRSASVAANPVLIGAVTVLVVIVAVFLAYNANNGLPFVPTYQLTAQLPDAANLVTGNEVRIGGDRVGIISKISPVVHKNGAVTAKLTMQLETKVKPLPIDSRLIVRPRSALGLKYVEITRGRSRKGFREGATIPLRNATPKPVEIDAFFNMFDKPTRDANQINLSEFGDALAGRGSDINEAIVALDPLTKHLIPVMRNLADPRTDLAGFFRGLERTAAAVAPVANEQGALFANLSTTFDAFGSIARPFLQDTISGGPHALDVATRSFPIQRPFLANSAGFFRELQPGARALVSAAPPLASAFTIGTTQVRRAAALNDRTTATLRAIQAFAQDPQVPLGIHGLLGTVQALSPTVADLAGAQLNCNYLGLLLYNAASIQSDGDIGGQGHWLRAIPIGAPTGPNGEVGPASAPANGPDQLNHLHANPYPLVGAPGQGGVCMAANETYLRGQTVIGNPPGQTPKQTAKPPANLNPEA